MLLKINQGIPTDLQHRFNELVAKRQSLTLSKAEHTELIQLGDHIEQLNTERIKHLAALAKLRNRSLAEMGYGYSRVGHRCPTLCFKTVLASFLAHGSSTIGCLSCIPLADGKLP